MTEYGFHPNRKLKVNMVTGDIYRYDGYNYGGMFSSSEIWTWIGRCEDPKKQLELWNKPTGYILSPSSIKKEIEP